MVLEESFWIITFFATGKMVKLDFSNNFNVDLIIYSLLGLVYYYTTEWNLKTSYSIHNTYCNILFLGCMNGWMDKSKRQKNDWFAYNWPSCNCAIRWLLFYWFVIFFVNIFDNHPKEFLKFRSCMGPLLPSGAPTWKSGWLTPAWNSRLLELVLVKHHFIAMKRCVYSYGNWVFTCAIQE